MKQTLLGLGCAMLLGLAPLGVAQAAETIRPGYWESVNRLLSPIPAKSTERRCITAADVEKFMMGPSNRHYTCTYPVRSFEAGKIQLKGSCLSKKGRRVKIEGHGRYAPTEFSLVADVATEWAGIPLAGRASTEAKRIADACPDPETVEKK